MVLNERSKHYSVETACSLISSNVVLLDKGQVAENLLKRVFVIYSFILAHLS
jgi:hypothetical protein